MKTRSLFRSQCGQIFGPIFTTRNSISIANNSSSSSLSLLDFNQPCIYTSADSGEIPGIYSTALLTSMNHQNNNNNINKNSNLSSPNQFTLKPIDWIMMCMNDSGFERRFKDFIEELISFSSSSSEEQNKVLLCPFSLFENTNTSQNNSISNNKNDWSSTQLLQWNIRSFVLATNLAYYLSFSSSSSSSSSSNNDVIFPPSLRWLSMLAEKSLEKGNSKNSSSSLSSSSLQNSYNSLLEDQTLDSGLYFMLPPLGEIVKAWKIVQKYGFGVVSSLTMGGGGENKNNLNSSSSSSIYPTLAPIVSTHYLFFSHEEEEEIVDNNTKKMTTTEKSNSSWSGFKGVKKKKTSTTTTNEEIKNKNSNSNDIRLRLLSLEQVASDSDLMSRIHSDEEEDRLCYVGTRCKKYYLPEQFRPHNQNNKTMKMMRNDPMLSSLGGERWYLVAEKGGNK